jgi:hypothetical protein
MGMTINRRYRDALFDGLMTDAGAIVPPSPPQKPAICSGNEESVERTVHCANPAVVCAPCLSLA